jgi:acetylornithine deacetylase/succinyl-diaminopimelate desuccinylase-like protein
MSFAKSLTGAAVAAALASPVVAQTLRPDQAQFRALYKELVETNTTLSAGSCTLAAARLAARLRTAGYTDAELTPFGIPEKPKEGGLVVVLKGSDPAAKAILLLAHLDVVEAKASDWTRDPFKLVEENGYFYARGASDDKSMAAIFTDTMIRLRSDKRLRRTVKLALTCGEETTYAFNGAQYLADNKRELIDAAFALNEGGGGVLDANGKRAQLGIQVGEKATQNYTLTVTNPGGHSSRPVKPNAIVQLAQAVVKLDALEFPVDLNPTTRAFFTQMSAVTPGPEGVAMKAIVANPNDAAANTLLSRDATLHSTLRTTCVATLAEAGHANNALPQKATANINCRIAPGESVQAVQATIVKTIADPAVTVTLVPPIRPTPGSPPLDPAIVEPARKLAAEMFPGVPMVPVMSTGASDAIFLYARGIPTYGVPGIFSDADYGGIHGLNEHISAKSIYDGRDYLYRLVRLYADAK